MDKLNCWTPAAVLGQTDQYGAAKDGYAWVSADGLWQWTTTATPNMANIIAVPPAVAPAAKKTAKVKTSSTTKKSTKSSKTAAASPSSNNLPSGGTPAGSLHPGILAGVGALAVVYALYEYRNDLANLLYKLHRYRETRRIAG